MTTAAILTMCAALAGVLPANGQENPPYKPGGGVTSPRLIREVKPEYPPDALSSGISGVVTLDCVVEPDGTAGDIRVTGSRGPELDAAAIKALKQWRFSPGQKDGKPVPVEVSVEIMFE